MSVRFIAEIGSNHNGSLERALALVEAASKAGFWGVKTQQYDPRLLFSAEALAHSPSLEKRPMLIPEWHEELSLAATQHGLVYGVSVFDPLGVDLAARWAHFLKISSYELLNHALIRRASASCSRLILSTGMASLEECQAALAASWPNCARTMLHCVSAYPAPLGQCNLSAIDSMQKRLCVPIGWSDHTKDDQTVLRAVHRWGATMVELHFDLEDGTGMEGYSHCWKPLETARLIEAAETMPDSIPRWQGVDGCGLKDPAPCELEERRWRADPFDGQRPRIEYRSYLRR